MKIVKSIEIIECENMQEYRIVIPKEIFNFANNEILDPWQKLDYIEETIKPQTFCNSNKESICIGFTKEVEETIGVVIGSFEVMNRENEILKKENEYYKNQTYEDTQNFHKNIIKLINSSFLKKLKFLFFGAKYTELLEGRE